MNPPETFTMVILENGPDGHPRFREEAVGLTERHPLLYLSEAMAGGRVQWRHSPPGYRMGFHPTIDPQWTFVLKGALEIGLPDGTRRVFRAGNHLYSTDTVPPGATFDPARQGHDSRTVGDETLVTVLVRG